jgi:hypothetical protein
VSDQRLDHTGFTPADPGPSNPATEPAGASETLQAAARRNPLARWSRTARGHLKELIGVLASIAVIAGGGFLDVFDELRGDSPGPQGETGSIVLSDVRLEERGVLIPDEATGVDVEANRISYTLEFLGEGTQQAYVGYAMYEAEDMTRLIPPPTDELGVEPDDELLQEKPNDKGSHSIDVPIPAIRQCVFIRVSVFGDKAATTRLAYQDSEPFDSHDASNERCSESGVTTGYSRPAPDAAGHASGSA